MAKRTVIVLTREVNQYDQEGAYFVAVFGQRPTVRQLAEALQGASVMPNDVMGALALVEHILAGGGRRGAEHDWYNLEEVELR